MLNFKIQADSKNDALTFHTNVVARFYKTQLTLHACFIITNLLPPNNHEIKCNPE